MLIFNFAMRFLSNMNCEPSPQLFYHISETLDSVVYFLKSCFDVIGRVEHVRLFDFLSRCLERKEEKIENLD